MQDYRITTDLNEMDFEVIHGFLSESYWSAGIPKATLRKGLDNSLCFGILDGQNRLAGFARMVTDKATFAYLADVFVVEAHRGKGLSKWLVSTIQHTQTYKGCGASCWQREMHMVCITNLALNLLPSPKY